jgi:hypothetical protein
MAAGATETVAEMVAVAAATDQSMAVSSVMMAGST